MPKRITQPNSHPRPALLLTFFLLVNVGCAAIWSPIQKTDTLFEMATIEAAAHLPVGWGSSSYSTLAGVWLFTRHGVELEEIYLRRFPKSQIVKGTNRRIRQDMTLQEIAELSIDSRRLDDGVGGFEVISNKPSRVGGRDCFRLDYRYRNAIGLPKRTLEYGCPLGDWMYRFEFNAPEQHYFEAHLSEFESMIKTLVFRASGA
ncbi:MAG: hypothetical protein AB8G23_03140 [Myxococcota bacterium]